MLRGPVRPVLVYSFFAAWLGVKLTLMVFALKQEPAISLLPVFWDEEEPAVVRHVRVVLDGLADVDQTTLNALTKTKDLSTSLSTSSSSSLHNPRKLLVRKERFELSRYCYRQPLKLVRLPVPPLSRGGRRRGGRGLSVREFRVLRGPTSSQAVRASSARPAVAPSELTMRARSSQPEPVR